MDDQRQARQINAARRNIGRNADPGAAVAQRLQRLIALRLAVLPGQCHRAESPVHEAGVQMADIVASGAEQHRRLRLVKPEQIHHNILDIGGCNRHRLIANVTMAALVADGGYPECIALIAFRQRNDRARHGGGE